MTSYIVVEIQKQSDGAVGTIVNAYENKNDAESRFHTVLAAAAISTVAVHSCVMFTEEGGPLRYESYHHEAEPEETAEE